MKRLYTAVAVLSLAAALSACGQKAAPSPAAPAPAPAASASSDMAAMGMAPAAKTAKGTGVVMAIDKAAGTITLDHGPLPEANWPAMTMAFKAAPALTDQVKVGDHVAFELKLEGGAGEVTAIHSESASG